MTRDAIAVKRAVAAGLAGIVSRAYDKKFINRDRAMRRAEMMNPTEIQARLLRYIEMNGPISFEESLGMDWRFLGGLFNRGLVLWNTRDGHKVLESTDLIEGSSERISEAAVHATSSKGKGARGTHARERA